jgi:SAM-dependent methyltransferase
VTQVIENQEMAAAWDHEAEEWLANAERYDRTGEHLWRRFLDAVPVAADAQVLDIGCGAGSTTLDLARIASSGRATGVDISGRMVAFAEAAAAAAGVGNVTFLHADAQVHPLPEADLAVSVFGTMFFGDFDAAFANIARAVRPGGELAMLTWRDLEHNEWLTAIREALAVGRSLPRPPAGMPGPFGLADGDHVRGVLTGAGFQDVELTALDEPMELGRDAEDAYDFVRTFGIVRGLTEDLDEARRQQAMEALRRTIEAHESGDGVLFGTGAWLVRARR